MLNVNERVTHRKIRISRCYRLFRALRVFRQLGTKLFAQLPEDGVKREADCGRNKFTAMHMHRKTTVHCLIDPRSPLLLISLPFNVYVAICAQTPFSLQFFICPLEVIIITRKRKKWGTIFVTVTVLHRNTQHQHMVSSVDFLVIKP